MRYLKPSIVFKTMLMALIVVLASCNTNDNEVVESEPPSITHLSIKDKNGVSYESFLNDSIIHVHVPSGGGILSSMDIECSYVGHHIKIDGKDETKGLDFSDFTNPHILTIYNTDGDTKSYEIRIYELPVLLINTPNAQPIISKEERVEGTEILLIDDDDNRLSLGTCGIRGRGNATWFRKDLLKRPYNIKLDSKHEILGMPKSKHWILLANAFWDRTQIHNATAFEMARLTDYPWVQKGRFVELILNGKHYGLYYLCEKIRIEKNRINIDELTPNDIEGDALTGGYLLETVNTTENTNYYTTDYINTTGQLLDEALGWEIKEPEEGAPLIQINYIKEYQSNVEKLLSDENSLKEGLYRDYLDWETAINWYLVQEATINVEAWASRNLFLYKPRGDSKLYLGPPWDFDAWTFGSRSVYTPGIFDCKNTAFYYRYLFNDPDFVSRLKEKWNNNIKDIWRDSIPKYIEAQYLYLHRSAERNERLFPQWHSDYNYPETTYKESVEHMKQTFLEQMEWLDRRINSY